MADQPIQKTRFEELGYQFHAPGLWRIIDLTDDMHSAVGQHYPTKAALLADLERYASEWGCDNAAPRHMCPVPYVNSYTELALMLLAAQTLENARAYLIDHMKTYGGHEHNQSAASAALRELASADAAVENAIVLLVGRFAR